MCLEHYCVCYWFLNGDVFVKYTKKKKKSKLYGNSYTDVLISQTSLLMETWCLITKAV